MTEQFILKDLLGKPIHIEFTEKNTTSDGGLIFAHRIIHKLNLGQRISEVIADPRNPNLITHEQSEQVEQRLLQLSAGYEDVNDAKTLRKDPMLTTLILEQKNRGKKEDKKQTELSSSPTLCRMENRVDRRALKRLIELQIDLYCQRNEKRFTDQHKQTGKLLICIDLDPTDIETHGQQPFAFYNGYYGHTGYVPMVIADGENGDLIAVIPRPGNRHATWFLRLIMKKLLSRISSKYPQALFKIRADSGFQSEQWFSFLELHPQIQTATIALACNATLEKLTKAAVQMFEQAYASREDKITKALIHFGEFGYRAESWSQFRRVIFQISKTNFGTTEVRYYFSTDHALTPEAIKLDYNQRSNLENRIKEWKTQMFASRVSGETFTVNAFRMLMSGFALIVFQELQKQLLNTVFANSYAATLREKLIKVAGVIQESTRRILLVLPQSYPYQSIWQSLLSSA
jgi:hypothetical protein